MNHANPSPVDPRLDLAFERIVDIPREKIWAAWTRPEQVVQWFTPAPWQTVECDIDLRPGGRFRTLMRSPEGQDFPNTGCFLEIEPDEKLVWTNALAPDFRPVEHAPGALQFTATIALETVPGGTRYSARASHGDAESCARHAAMGFGAGWGKALDQLVAMVKRM